MAAGLSIQAESFWTFKREFSKAIKKHLNGKTPEVETLTDGQLSAADVTLKNAELIRQSSPWGQGFEEPTFYGDFEIIEQKVVGEKHLKCRLKLKDSKNIFDGIAFFQEKLDKKQVSIVYKLNVNSFRGNESLQLMIESIC
jgi:single-stranded-DNA-specific exonuclease